MGDTYLGHVSAQRFLAKDMQSLVNGSKRLAGVHIGTGRNPDSLKSRMIEHLIVVVIDRDVELLVLFALLSPRDFVLH
jgi:hypothetical protein